MFGTIKTEKQKVRSAESQGHMDKLYERINEQGLRRGSESLIKLLIVN